MLHENIRSKRDAIKTRFKIAIETTIIQSQGNRVATTTPPAPKTTLFPSFFPLGDIMVLIVRNCRAFCALFHPFLLSKPSPPRPEPPFPTKDSTLRPPIQPSARRTFRNRLFSDMTAELIPTSDAVVLSDSIRVPPGAAPAVLYLGELHTEYSKRTMRSALNLFARWGGAADFTQVNWAMLTPAAVSSFLRRQLALGKSGVSVNLYLAALKGVAKAAWQLELLDHDSLERIRSVKQVRVSRLPAGRSLSYAESAALLSAAAGDDPKKVRDRAILTLFLGCGLRRAEVCGLQLDKVDVLGGTIRLIGKGNKERKAFLTPDMQRTVAEWLDVRTEVPGYLFGNYTVGRRLRVDRPLNPSSLSRILKKYCDAAGVDPVTPHDLRRTFATRLIDKNVDLVTVKNLMGHANIATTSLYDRRGEDTMRNAARLVQI